MHTHTHRVHASPKITNHRMTGRPTNQPAKHTTEPKWSISLFRVLSYVAWCVPLLLCSLWLADCVVFISFFLLFFRSHFLWLYDVWLSCSFWLFWLTTKLAKGSDIRMNLNNLSISSENDKNSMEIFASISRPRSQECSSSCTQHHAASVNNEYVWQPSLDQVMFTPRIWHQPNHIASNGATWKPGRILQKTSKMNKAKDGKKRKKNNPHYKFVCKT